LNQDEHQAARQVFGDNIIPVVACKSAIKEVVAKAQRGEMKKQISAMDEQFIVRLVDDIIRAAIQRNASDIHIEPLNDQLRVRFRQDGVLIHFEDFPAETAPAVASRIKVLCEVDITERRQHRVDVSFSNIRMGSWICAHLFTLQCTVKRLYCGF
jgi:type IV pilus assembly protein PilB